MGRTMNANTATFEAVTIFDVPMLFTSGYVDPETLPQGVYQYAVRHSSNEPDKPAQITDWTVVNRYGSLLSSIPISMDKVPGSYVKKRDLDSEGDWLWNGYHVKLCDYLDLHPVLNHTNRQVFPGESRRNER